MEGRGKVAAFAVVVISVAVLVLMWSRENRLEEVEPPARDGAILLVENLELGAEDLRRLESSYGPVEEKRRVTEIVPLGQSVLCDVYTSEDGDVAFTFLTPQTRIGDLNETILVFQFETWMLGTDGVMDRNVAPSVATREGQQATISIGTSSDASFSIGLSGLLVGGDAIAVSVEFSGEPGHARSSH